jgi:hypothetical protein
MYFYYSSNTEKILVLLGDTSIDIEYSCKREKVKWIRAKDLSSNPQFIVNGISKDDLDQGYK